MRRFSQSANNNRIEPPPEFVEQANLTDSGVYEAFENDWPDCWERVASFLDWHREHDSVVEEMNHPPYHRWFVDGQVNAAENCVDRHVRAGRGDEPAIQWIAEDGETQTYTYSRLLMEINEVAAMLRDLGVGPGDPVALYLPRLPELPIMMLAAARIGAPHVVVFAEYSGSILADFMRETGAQTLITSSGYYKDGEPHSLKSKAQVGVKEVSWDVTTVVLSRTGTPESSFGLEYESLRQEVRGQKVEPVPRPSDAGLFVCYASGPTGEPIGMEHVVGEYLPYVAWTAHAVLDIKPEDTFWCPAGVEWITGHSYVVYGPLALGATTILYEGAPSYPDEHRPWQIIDDNDVTQFYTTPTAIRTFMEWGEAYPTAHDLSSLRLLGTVGQRIETDTWHWFYEHVGGSRCPIVDTWYLAETGGITISTLPGICDMKPGSVGQPLPGIDASIVDADGDAVALEEAGYLVLDRPWPGFFRPVRSPDRTAREYWTEFGDPGKDWVYFTEDGAVADDEGYITILGRIDDVINIGYYSKNRVHVSEIERAIADLDVVNDVAVICGEHDIKGEAPYAFVVADRKASSDLRACIADKVEDDLASPARPEAVFLISELPQTYDGGTLRQPMEDLLNGERLGDVGLLRNPDVLDNIAVEIRNRALFDNTT